LKIKIFFFDKSNLKFSYILDEFVISQNEKSSADSQDALTTEYLQYEQQD